MPFFYLIGIWGMYSTMWIASFFHPKAKKWIAGRKNVNWAVPKKPVYWFHCASLGEFDQGLPVMNLIKERKPEIHLLVTFFSPSGMDHYQKRDHHVDEVQYLPLDTPRNARRFIAHYKPAAAFFVKYEIWYFHILAAAKANVKIYGVCNIFRPEHRFFKWYGGIFRKALRAFNHFFVQNAESIELLETIGLSNATVVGDTRYDRMIDVVEKVSTNATLESFTDGERVLILGSSWPGEESLFYTQQNEIAGRYKTIIAPHDISASHIEGIQSSLVIPYCRYSQGMNPKARVLILDTIGNLTAAYQYAHVAFVGGGFSGSLHNILEPGAFQVPVIFGPKHSRFPEAELFLSKGAAREIDGNQNLLEVLSSFEKERENARTSLSEIFRANRGAAEKIVHAVLADELHSY